MSDIIRAIFFDLDGVLVDAKKLHFEALNRALGDFNLIPITYEEHLTRYDGLPTREKLVMLSKIQSIPELRFAAINSLKQQYTFKIAHDECRPSLVQIEAMKKLKEEGYRLAVCTNAIRASLDLFLEKLCLQDFFELTLSNQDISRPKPDPEIYLTAMNRMSVDADETLIFEDQSYGIQAARASGAHVSVIDNIAQINYGHIADVIARIENDRMSTKNGSHD